MGFIYADNYRGFEKQIIPLQQVNFMVGENSTGKSSILDLLDVFGNRNFWVLEPDFILSNGKTKNFNDLVSAASKTKSKFTIAAWDTLEGEMQTHGIIVTYRNRNGVPKISRVSYLRGQIQIIIDNDAFSDDSKYLSVKKTLNADRSNSAEDFFKYLLKKHESNAGFLSEPIPEAFKGAPLQIIVTSLVYDKNNEKKKVMVETLNAEDKTFSVIMRIPRPFAMEFVNMAPIRALPRRTYDDSLSEFNKDGKHTPYLIRKMLGRSSAFDAYIKEFGEKSGLFNSIEIKSYGKSLDSPFEIKINLGAKGLDMGNVGLGVSQSLPLLVEMFSRNSNTSFAIQQPEVHLHPRAQAQFGSIVYTISKNENKYFFVETHSDFTIDRFRIEIKKQKKYVDSQILFFTKSNGFNKVVPISIDKDGEISEKQPDSYRKFFINETFGMLV